jgi:hypothetical protein
MMMLSLMSTLLLVNDDTDNADDADDVDNTDDVNDANDADADDANNERRRRSSIEERKESRLDTSFDRVERLVMCCFFAPLAVSQAEPTDFRIVRLFQGSLQNNVWRFSIHVFDRCSVQQMFDREIAFEI